MMVATQYGGWAATPNAIARPSTAFERMMAQRWGGREDNLYDFLDNPGYKTTMGSALGRAPGGDYSDKFRNSGMAPKSFGGSNTGDDPGASNWDTFQRNVNRVANIGAGVVSWRMQNKRMSQTPASEIKDLTQLNRLPQMISKSANTMRRSYPNAPGLTLGQAQELAQRIRDQYGGTSTNKQVARNPGVKKPKSTAPRISNPTQYGV